MHHSTSSLVEWGRRVTFTFRIDRRSGVPSYVQIVQQVQQGLRLGLLVEGDRLPTARAVVEATALNPNTVLKAYRELESQGLVQTRRRHGTFVTGSLGATSAESPWRAELAGVAGRARDAGLERDDLAALFGDVLDDLYPPPLPPPHTDSPTPSPSLSPASPSSSPKEPESDAAPHSS
ncbi:GntR family transcriptional regulator [Streptomyces sp. NPDC002530]